MKARQKARQEQRAKRRQDRRDRKARRQERRQDRKDKRLEGRQERKLNRQAERFEKRDKRAENRDGEGGKKIADGLGKLLGGLLGGGQQAPAPKDDGPGTATIIAIVGAGALGIGALVLLANGSKEAAKGSK